MAENFESLARKSVADLRAVAKGIEHEALAGHALLAKEDLVRALCRAQDIAIPEHRKQSALDRRAVKAKIQTWKEKRKQALEAHDASQLARARRRIQRLKRKLRAASI